MPNLRDIRRKIEAVKKIGQITRAMNMVAAAKLRGAQTRLEKFRPYGEKYREVIRELVASGAVLPSQFPLMETREVRNVGLILVTADRGLCGAFNTNLIKEAEKFMAEQAREGRQVKLICVGKKGAQYFRKRAEILEAYTDVMGRVLMQDARTIARRAMRAFLDGEIDEAYLLYGYFINVVRQIPKREKLLPISVEKGEAEEKAFRGAPIYEPSPEELLDQILPMYVNTRVFAAMLETAVSEQASRMTAMDNATRACGDMVRDLTLLFNKTRQASITKELMDIVGGAEALKKA
ncbi:ATP synthase F1 subunit gamma [Thermosulfurimonas marina]|uniref:ATP synthase gamma chain n=1 Tax=Thermosulfurimonas marina TaxID=2047767 RepID=A0A6H1WSA8_9BACT|nr:ATP synthase F1 subunit gamma [Thermosulfurimonas marina]QJA06105.1 ATP synthase F1 subunit gamma [Thermosulfurimonas marina]